MVRAELGAFIDGLIEAKLQEKPAAGALVVVVKDGAVLFAKGYGYADVAKRIPVDPVNTLFRPGSISKLFTWTAVMQLVEQGRLNLDVDVNTYLKDFKIPATYPEPVTLRNLMTHTAGFEDGGIGYEFGSTEKDYLPLATYLQKHMPARVRSPTTDFNNGTGAAYSNWGAALAGLIVQTVSGMPFDDYIDKFILQPLGMTSSTFREPLPAALAARLSSGYKFTQGAFEPQEFELIHNFAPAGSLSSTGADMAKFMLAFLRPDASGSARILAPETIKLMQRRSLSPDPALSGMDLGFFDMWINGRRTVWHGGDTLLFHSSLSLVPEANLGIFVSLNTGGQAHEAAREFEREFLDHYFPAQLPQIKPPPDAQARNTHFAGSYRLQLRSYTRFDKVLAAFGDFDVEAMPDGTLSFDELPSGKPARWTEVDRGVFRNIERDSFVAFKDERNGHATYLLGPWPVLTFHYLAWYDRASLHALLLAVAMGLFVSVLVSAIRHRRADRQGPAYMRWARPSLAVTGLLLITCVVGLAGALTDHFGSLEFSRIPFALYAFLSLPLLAIPLTVAAVLFTILAWQRGAWSLLGRLHYTLGTAGALVVFWMLNYWNLLGFRFG